MLNVQDHYTYKTKSIDKVNNIAIHPLSNRSLNEYISNSSYANKFLDKTKLIKTKDFKADNLTENNDENNNCNITNKKNNRNSSNIFFNSYDREENKNMFSTQYANKNETQDYRKSMLNQLNDDKSFMKLVGRYNTSNNKSGNKFKEYNYNPISNMNTNYGNYSNDNTKNFKSSSLLQMRKTMNNLEQFRETNKATTQSKNNLNPSSVKNSNDDIKLNNLHNHSNNHNNMNVKNPSDFKNNYNSLNNQENNCNSMNLGRNNQTPSNLNNKLNFQNKFSAIKDLNSNNNQDQNQFNDKTNNNQKLFIRSNSIDAMNNFTNSSNNFNNLNNNKTSKTTLKHDGFSLNNIPRVDTLYTMSDPKFLNYSHTNFHCKKIINSLHLSNNLKVKDEMEKISKVELRKVNKAKSPKDFVEKLCGLENSKYGRIFNMQMSKEFLDERQLPEIKYEKKDIDVAKNFYNNGNSKFMGVKYNPYNYDLIASKNRTKRNVFGTLFIN